MTRRLLALLCLAGLAGCVHRIAVKAPSDNLVEISLPQPPCPPGTEESGGLATSGAIYLSGCRTPEEKTKAEAWFAEMWCDEMSISALGADWGFSHHSEWKDGKCQQEDIYEVNGKQVSKEEFERRHPIKCDPGTVQDGAGCRWLITVRP